MPVINVTHRCGHQARHKVAGNSDNARREREFRAGQDCGDCYASAIRTAAAADNAAAAAANQDAGLPALTGSEKQVAWAESIRRTQLAKLEEELADEHPDAAAIVRGIARRQTRAGWWIDHRGGLYPSVLLDVYGTDEEYDAVQAVTA